MDLIGRIRRLHVRDKLSEREIARMTGLSRNTVSKWLRAPVAEAPKYRREARPNKLSAFETALKQALTADARRPKHERRTARALHAEIKAAGYSGGYSAVTDFVRAWRRKMAPARRGAHEEESIFRRTDGHDPARSRSHDGARCTRYRPTDICERHRRDGSRPWEDLELQDGRQYQVVAGKLQSLAFVSLRESKQPAQCMPPQRLGRRDVVGRDLGAPAVVVELEDQETASGRENATGLARKIFRVNLLRDLPGQMECADTQRAGNVAMEAEGRQRGISVGCLNMKGWIVVHLRLKWCEREARGKGEKPRLRPCSTALWRRQDTCQDASSETAQSPHDDEAGAARRGVEHDGHRVAQEGTRGRPSRTRYRPRTRNGVAPTCRGPIHELRHPGPAPPRIENSAAQVVVVLAGTLTARHDTACAPDRDRVRCITASEHPHLAKAAPGRARRHARTHAPV